MKVHVLVEGTSEREFFDRWGPRCNSDLKWKIHPHQGKGTFASAMKKNPNPRRRGLLDQLPRKLAGWAKGFDRSQEKILVVLDTDADSIGEVRLQFEELVQGVDECPPVELVLATEELEAFYLGDLAALKRAYPQHDAKMAKAYVPDSVVGTWELFGAIIGDGGGRKVEWAKTLGGKTVAQKTPRKSRKAKAASPQDASGRRRR